MLLEEKILQAIYCSIDEANKNLDSAVAISKVPQNALFGNSALDSMVFVSLVMLIEDNVGSALGVALDLMGEDFLIEGDNPFSTIETLAAFVQKKISQDTMPQVPKPG